MTAQGWYRDPFGVHGDRWFSAGQPTALVRDAGGVESHDEPPGELPDGELVAVDETLSDEDGSDLLRAGDSGSDSSSTRAATDALNRMGSSFQ